MSGNGKENSSEQLQLALVYLMDGSVAIYSGPVQINTEDPNVSSTVRNFQISDVITLPENSRDMSDEDLDSFILEVATELIKDANERFTVEKSEDLKKGNT
jgi:hypothetical protein